MNGPVSVIEISDFVERRGGRVRVTVAATGKTIWLPAGVIQIWPRRVILPLWLYEKYKMYLHQPTQPGGLSCQ